MKREKRKEQPRYYLKAAMLGRYTGKYLVEKQEFAFILQFIGDVQ